MISVNVMAMVNWILFIPFIYFSYESATVESESEKENMITMHYGLRGSFTKNHFQENEWRCQLIGSESKHF